MPYPLPLTRTEAYLAYKAGVIQQSDLKPSLAVSRNGIDAWLAYWTGLAADYPKREDGTPHILQEEEAYIAYLCGVINEYPEKCLRRVGAYLRYLISARWGRPDHPLNREELYLSMLKTQYIPSGDPSSDIVIDGTAKAPFVDVKMYGDTTQDSYTGKNLLEIRPSDNSRGLTIVNNARTGELTFSGTTTQGYPWLNESFPDLPAGTYTFSIDKPVSKTLFLRLYNEAGEYPVTLQFTEGNISDTKTTDYAIKRTVLLYGETSSGATVAEQTIKPMLEAGSSVTSFEPYVGGIPSPNPDYPQPIQTVTGEQTVEIVGKNKIKSSTTGSINWQGTKITYAGNQITINKTSNGGISANAHTDTVYTPLNANQAYTFSMSYKSGTINLGYTDYWRFYLYAVSADGTISITNRWTLNIPRTTTTPSASVTFTPSEDLVGYRLGCYIPGPSPTTTGDVVFNVQLELGSTATSFAPYNATSYSINLGSTELCKLGTYQDYIWKDGDSWKVHKATNKIVVDGTENWAYPNSGENYTFFQFSRNGFRTKYGNAADFYASTTEVGFAKADKFKQIVASAANMRTEQGIGFTTEGSGWFRISIANTIATTIATFKEWLAENVTTVNYALATPTDTVITDQELIAQLEALVKGGSEEGTTYIKLSTPEPNLPGLLYVEAAKYV